ncbi:MAG TPA: CRISPR-associated protein, partial [Planctomycetaceae bacterium]
LILDEAQTLPVELLAPCLAVLRELAADYRCSVVLCTATQPAVTRREGFPIGLDGVREIVPDPPALYESMRRVRIESVGTLTDDDLVSRLSEHDRFLCVVNTRPHAGRLFDRLRETADDDGLFHLSTFMCAEHRSQVLREVRRRLKEGRPCKVVSTQLIEAGVDVDFPVVYRALAGLDSVAQAAGRCNREGRLPGPGVVYLFRPEGRLPRGLLGATARTTEELLALGGFDDLLGLDAVRCYFELHYWKQKSKWDANGILEQFATPQMLQFRTAAERFRFIEDGSRPVIVPWGEEGRRLVEAVRGYQFPDRHIRRRLQRYLVPIPEPAFDAMLGSDLESHHEGAFTVLLNEDLYDDRLGLRLDRAGQHDPESLVV